MVYIYIYNLLHKNQLHVLVLDNGHLQVEIEKLSKQLYSTYVGCIQWGGKKRGGHVISCPPHLIHTHHSSLFLNTTGTTNLMILHLKLTAYHQLVP